MDDSSIFQPHEWKMIYYFLGNEKYFDLEATKDLRNEIKDYLEKNGYGEYKEKRRRKRKRNN